MGASIEISLWFSFVIGLGSILIIKEFEELRQNRKKEYPLFLWGKLISMVFFFVVVPVIWIQLRGEAVFWSVAGGGLLVGLYLGVHLLKRRICRHYRHWKAKLHDIGGQRL